MGQESVVGSRPGVLRFVRHLDCRRRESLLGLRHGCYLLRCGIACREGLLIVRLAELPGRARSTPS